MNAKPLAEKCPTAPSNTKKIHVKKANGFWWAWLPANRGWTAHETSFVIFNRVRVALEQDGFLDNVVIFGKTK